MHRLLPHGGPNLLAVAEAEAAVAGLGVTLVPGQLYDLVYQAMQSANATDAYNLFGYLEYLSYQLTHFAGTFNWGGFTPTVPAAQAALDLAATVSGFSVLSDDMAPSFEALAKALDGPTTPDLDTVVALVMAMHRLLPHGGPTLLGVPEAEAAVAGLGVTLIPGQLYALVDAAMQDPTALEAVTLMADLTILSYQLTHFAGTFNWGGFVPESYAAIAAYNLATFPFAGDLVAPGAIMAPTFLAIAKALDGPIPNAANIYASANALYALFPEDAPPAFGVGLPLVEAALYDLGVILVGAELQALIEAGMDPPGMTPEGALFFAAFEALHEALVWWPGVFQP